jgi:uncharacterized protein YdhG (YjbR/CyaY superfamily)
MSTPTKQDDALPNIGAPATRALAAIGITQLSQLSSLSEAALADLHGVGPKAIRILHEALDEQGKSFARQGKASATNTMNTQVDEYLAKLPADKQAALQKLRKQIHAAAPGAVETMSYGVPTFKLHGKMLVSMGAAKDHCALYGGSGDVVEAYAVALKDFSLSKGTIRFTPKKPIPATVVKNLVKTRVAQIETSSAKKRKG